MIATRSAGGTAGQLISPRTALGAAVVALVLLSVVLWSRWPFVSPESAIYLRNVFRDLPLATLVFDVRANDLGNYQARELSYLFDLLDSWVVAEVYARTGRLVPVSATALAAWVTIAAVNVRVLRRAAPTLDPWLAVLPSLLFVTSPAIALGSGVFHTAKALCAVLAFAVAWCLTGLVRGTAVQPGRDAVALLAFAMPLVLVDRQGMVFVAVGCCVAASAWLSSAAAPTGRRDPTARVAVAVLTALVVALGIGAAYTWWLGPSLIRRFADQEVDWSWMQGTTDALRDAPMAHLAAGVRWALSGWDALAGVLGTWWGAVLAAGTIAAAALLARPGRSRAVVLGCSATALVGLAAAGTAMAARHPAIDLPDVRASYYAQPLVAVLVVVVSGLLAVAAAQGRSLGAWRRLGVALVLANLLAIPRRFEVLRTENHAGQFVVTQALVDCLAQPDAPPALFFVGMGTLNTRPNYVGLCREYRALRSRSRGAAPSGPATGASGRDS